MARAKWRKKYVKFYLAYYYIKAGGQTGVKIPVESERGKMRINMAYIESDLNNFHNMLEKSQEKHKTKVH